MEKVSPKQAAIIAQAAKEGKTVEQVAQEIKDAAFAKKLAKKGKVVDIAKAEAAAEWAAHKAAKTVLTAKEKAAALKETVVNAPVVTAGGVAPRAKGFRPFYVPEWDGAGAATKKDSNKDRAAKDSFAGQLVEPKDGKVRTDANFKSGSAQRTKDGEFRGKTAVTSGLGSAPRNAAERKASKERNKIYFVPKKVVVNEADKADYKKDYKG